MPRSNTSTRILPHPAIEDGNFSFPQGDYQVNPEQSGNSDTGIVLQHKLEGAPFIEELIDQGKAKFACLVSVSKTGYRKLNISENNKQEIHWDSDVAGKHPLLRPGVLYVGEDLKGGIWAQEHGVADIWLNQGIYIPRGARLVRGRYLLPRFEGLITAECYEDMKPGTFTVKANVNDGFSFQLRAAKDIFDFIQRDRSALRNSIMTHAVSECFNILKTKYSVSDEGEEKNRNEEGEDGSGDEWGQYSNLVALSELLKNKGVPHWSEDGFDAVKVATELYPIKLNDSADGHTREEDND